MPSITTTATTTTARACSDKQMTATQSATYAYLERNLFQDIELLPSERPLAISTVEMAIRKAVDGLATPEI
jgi:hypothetical protein